MRYVKPSQARVTYYNAEGKTIEAREYPTKDMGGYSVVDTSEPPEGAAYQRSQGVYTIDPLGAATPEQTAERKATPAMRIFNAVLMTVVLVATGLVLMGAGIYIGATDPDTWTQLPFTPEPSGERAEPEEGVK